MITTEYSRTLRLPPDYAAAVLANSLSMIATVAPADEVIDGWSVS